MLYLFNFLTFEKLCLNFKSFRSLLSFCATFETLVERFFVSENNLLVRERFVSVPTSGLVLQMDLFLNL